VTWSTCRSSGGNRRVGANAAPKRRSVTRLESRLREARTDEERANAEYELGLFHDNNSREAEAIPHYEAALRLGLAGGRRAECLAWLASSLYKTGRAEAALQRLRQSRDVAEGRELMDFLLGLERRIRARISLP
jgi:tetratricopeptide (TPR) repeat protein